MQIVVESKSTIVLNILFLHPKKNIFQKVPTRLNTKFGRIWLYIKKNKKNTSNIFDTTSFSLCVMNLNATLCILQILSKASCSAFKVHI